MRGRTVRRLAFLCVLGAMGCAHLSRLETRWTENYALDATVNAEGLNDGKTNTVASTPLKADPREFIIEFPEPRRVQRIRLVNANLYRFSVAYWDMERKEWKAIQTVVQRRDVEGKERRVQPLFEFTHFNVETNKIRVEVTRTVDDLIVSKVAPNPDDKILERVRTVVGKSWIEYYRVILESPAQIRELEIYGVLPRKA